MSDRDLTCKNCGKEIESRGWTHDDSIFCELPGLQYAEPTLSAPVEPVPAPEFVDESHDEGCECRTSRKETAVCDCDEPAPVPEGEGEVPNCIWMIHDGNPTSWNYCPNCGAYLKAAAPPVGTQE